MTLSVLAWPKNRNRQENPYNFLVYRDMSEDVLVEEFNHRSFSTKGFNILHVHWPDRLLDDKRQWRLRWRFWRFMHAINRLRKRGGKVIWTVHNLHSREIRFQGLADSLLKKFIQSVDGFIFLSAASQQLFFQHYDCQDRPLSTVIPHPHYRDVYLEQTMQKARAALSISESSFVLGFFGKIRANKGLDTLVRCFDDSMADQARLLLAGSADKRGLSALLQQHLRDNPATIGLLNYIQPEEVGTIIGACNVLIFPYEDILNSGSSFLALSLGRPIIAPNIGSFPELKERIGNNWVYLYDQPLDRSKLKAAISWAKTETGLKTHPNLDYASPSQVSKLTERFYRQVLAV